MSSNFVAGLVSGIDTTALIDALVTSRSGPISLLERRQAERTAQLSAWKAFEATLIGLKVGTDALGKSSLWDTPRVVSSDEEILSVTADGTAALGSYDLFVQQLAQSHQLQSVAYGSRTELVGSGTLSITVGSTATDLTVAAGTTLEGLVDQINAADLGATAAVVRSDTGSGQQYYLVLTSDETGTGAQLSVGSALAGGTDPVLTTEVRAAQNAQIAFGGEGGLVLESTTNVFEDVVEGVDVTVHRAMSSGERLSVTVDRDAEGLEEKVAAFVESYNAVLAFVNEQYRFDPDSGVRPPLMGDGSLTSVVSRLRSLVTSPVNGAAGSIRSAFALGIRSSADGTLTFDRSKFQDAIDSDFDAVANLFRRAATFDVPGLRMLSAPASVDLSGRTVEIDVTQVATRAVITGDDADFGGNGIDIDATNDSFVFVIDGIVSETLSIAHGTYTAAQGDALAQAIEDAIDGSTQLGALGVQVSFEATGAKTGRFVFASNGFGAGASLEVRSVVGSTFTSTVGLQSQAGTSYTGTDMEATIDGFAAEVNGQALTAPEEAGDLAGATFLFSGTSTATFQGTITEGIAGSLSRQLARVTDSVDGVVARISGSIQRMIEATERDIAAKQERLESYRAQLQRRYARMESLLGELQSQGSFLSAQIQSMSSGSSGFGTSNG